MQTHEILTAAADLLDKPGAWTQGVFALDSEGNETYSAGDDAVCWCVLGALNRVKALDGSPYSFLGQVIGVSPIDVWNDDPTRTQSEVVSALRKASELAQRAATSQRAEPTPEPTP